ARRLVAAALRAAARTSAAARHRAARCERSLLPVYRIDLDGAADSLGAAVLCDRRAALGGVGHLRGRRGIGGRALAGRLLRPQPRAALVAPRRRRRAGLQRALLRTDHHGRSVAQQPPRLPGLGAPWASRQRDRSGVARAVRAGPAWPGLERE